MTDILIIEKAIKEIETKTLGMTKQFLKIHKVVCVDKKPKVASLDTNKDKAVVYFNVEGEKFFFAVYMDTIPTVSVSWSNTQPYHSVYFNASSDKLSLKELSCLTTLSSTRGRNKGDKKRPGGDAGISWKQSAIFFEPNPGPGEFEDKLTRLLDYLEQDKKGVEKLVEFADGYIQVYSSFHNGNTMIGGHHLEKDQVKRMSKLNLEIDFDITADGNLFK